MKNEEFTLGTSEIGVDRFSNDIKHYFNGSTVCALQTDSFSQYFWFACDSPVIKYAVLLLSSCRELRKPSHTLVS